MKVLILGIPYFAKKIAQNLAEFDNKNNYLFLDTNVSFLDKFKYLIHIFSTDIVYSIGGTLTGSKTISLALILKKKIIMHWVGTDVLLAKKSFKDNTVQSNYIKKVSHFAEVYWIREALSLININAEIVQFVTLEGKISCSKELPKKFSILSYVVTGMEAFYGMDYLIKVAQHFPNIIINIVGISKYHEILPKNIKLLGWVNDMEEYYKNCVLYLRIPQHDGLAFSVLEALANARYVGYSHDFPSTFFIDSIEKLFNIVNDLKNKFDSGLLKSNLEGTNFIKNNYSKKQVLNSLIEHFYTLESKNA